MPSHSGGELDALFVEEERSAHFVQRIHVVEPDESVLIESPPVGRPPLDFVNQGEPAAVEGNQLGATPESRCCDGGRSLDYGPPAVVYHPGRIAQIDELQPITGDLRHPVLLVQS